MKFLVSRKVVISAVFIILVLVGAYVIKSPVDSQFLFTFENAVMVIGAALGITGLAKIVQAKILDNRLSYDLPPAVSWLQKLWSLLDPTEGVVMAVVSFVLATVLVYWRLIDFATWFGYHATFLVYFNTVNVAKK